MKEIFEDEPLAASWDQEYSTIVRAPLSLEEGSEPIYAQSWVDGNWEKVAAADGMTWDGEKWTILAPAPEWLTQDLMVQEGLKQVADKIVNERGQVLMTYGKELKYNLVDQEGLVKEEIVVSSSEQDQWWYNLVPLPMERGELPEDENEAIKLLAPNLLPDPRTDMEAYQRAYEDFRLQALHEGLWRLKNGYLLMTPITQVAWESTDVGMSFLNSQIWGVEMSNYNRSFELGESVSLYGRKADQGVKPVANLRLAVAEYPAGKQPVVTNLVWAGRPEDEPEGYPPLKELTIQDLRAGMFGIHPEIFKHAYENLLAKYKDDQYLIKSLRSVIETIRSEQIEPGVTEIVQNNFFTGPIEYNQNLTEGLSPDYYEALVELQQLIAMTSSATEQEVRGIKQELGLDEMASVFQCITWVVSSYTILIIPE